MRPRTIVDDLVASRSPADDAARWAEFFSNGVSVESIAARESIDAATVLAGVRTFIANTRQQHEADDRARWQFRDALRGAGIAAMTALKVEYELTPDDELPPHPWLCRPREGTS
jgi:hypothetical protein